MWLGFIPEVDALPLVDNDKSLYVGDDVAVIL